MARSGENAQADATKVCFSKPRELISCKGHLGKGIEQERVEKKLEV